MSTSSSLFLYRMSSSSSELPSLLQISSIVGLFCDSSFLSKHLLFRFFYVRLCFDGFVVMLEISVFGFRPKWALNEVIFVVEFGISLMLSMIFPKSTVHQLGSMSNTANRFFIVCINRLTMPVPPCSPTGARIHFRFLFLQNSSNSFALNACALSHLIERGVP